MQPNLASKVSTIVNFCGQYKAAMTSRLHQ